MSGFEDKLLELLPGLYRKEDLEGELRSFLKIPAITLDELQKKIDRFPELFDVDQCEPRFLPLLAEIVGYRFDPLDDAERQRREIQQAIEFYRRKGSIPAITRSLHRIGWEGRITEGFHHVLRLNRRAVVGESKLPGRIHSFGTYRIESNDVYHGIREALSPHHPAGARVFFLQWLLSQLEMGAVDSTLKEWVRRVCLGHLHETLTLNHNALNADFHLTRKIKNRSLALITSNTTLTQNFHSAGTRIGRWHGRTPRFRLNASDINSERLSNLWVSERKLIISHEVDPNAKDTGGQTRFVSLTKSDLNTSRLNRSSRGWQYLFRQKDMPSHAEQEQANWTDYLEASYSNRVRFQHRFRLGHSQVSGGEKINATGEEKTLLLASYAETQWSEVRQAADRVDRWPIHRFGFKLNAKALNGEAITGTPSTEARLSLTLAVDTGYPRVRRIETLSLNRRELNQTGLRLSVNRAHPLRLGQMALNQAGFRPQDFPYRWLYRQKDHFVFADFDFDSIQSNDSPEVSHLSHTRMDQKFRLGRSCVGGSDRMLYRQGEQTLLFVSCVVLQWGGVRGAWDLVDRQPTRHPGFGLNTRKLNNRSLSSVLYTAERACFEMRVDVGDPTIPHAKPLRMNESPLNQSGPRPVEQSFVWRIHQHDERSLAEMEPAIPAGNDTPEVSFLAQARSTRRFRFNRSRLGGRDPMLGRANEKTAFHGSYVSSRWGGVRYAADRLNRWPTHLPGFGLNAGKLNQAAVTATPDTAARLALETYTDVGDPKIRKVVPTTLNGARLNATGLRNQNPTFRYLQHLS